MSTDAIVAAAGVTRGALYHQFADKTALFDAVLEAVEADIARRLADDAAAAGVSDPVDAMRHVLRTWLEICVEPEIHRIALIDGPSVVGWAHWREVCQRHVFGLAQAMLEQGIEAGRIRPQPVRALAHVLMGASDEAALYVAESADPAQARADMLQVLDRLIDVVSAWHLPRPGPRHPPSPSTSSPGSPCSPHSPPRRTRRPLAPCSPPLTHPLARG